MSGSTDSDATWSPGIHTLSQGDHGVPLLEPFNQFVNYPNDEQFSENLEARDVYTGLDAYPAWGRQNQTLHIYVATDGHGAPMTYGDTGAHHFSQHPFLVGSGHDFGGNAYATMERYGPDSAYTNAGELLTANAASYQPMLYGTNDGLATGRKPAGMPREGAPINPGNATNASPISISTASPSIVRHESRGKVEQKGGRGKRARSSELVEKPKKKTSKIAPKPPVTDLDKRAESPEEANEDDKVTENEFRTDPAYKNLVPDANGFYHCPFKNDAAGCSHGMATRKCEANRWLDSHLKPFRCEVPGCEAKVFSSAATLSRHKKEMHSDIKYTCNFKGCNRNDIEHGFDRQYNRDDHMKRTHNWRKDGEGVDEDQPEVPPTKKSRTQVNESVSDNTQEKRPELASRPNQQIERLREEWIASLKTLHRLLHDVENAVDIDKHEKIFATTDQLKALHYEANNIQLRRVLNGAMQS